MPQVIQHPSIKVLTKDGEISINLELTINLNINGGNTIVETKVEPKEISTQSIKIEDKAEEKTNWAIPDFSNNFGNKIKFGKKIE